MSDSEKIKCTNCDDGIMLLNIVCGYLHNPWGFYYRCNKCGFDKYYDNIKYDESKAIFDDDGRRIG